MPKSVTASSTPKLSEVARHVVIPSGILTTAWPRVVALLATVGVFFDAWQHGIGSIALGKRKDGKYAATVGGVVLSIPRQVGKTFLVGMIVIALCILNPGMTVLWTAHRMKTATMTFGTIKGYVQRKKFAPYLAKDRSDGIRSTNGDQEIRFANGSRILFGAREQGFGRGFDEVDIEVFDEAQILTEKALEDMVAATNQSRQESGALLFFMGTPPRPADPGEEFTNRRAKALLSKVAVGRGEKPTAPNMVYVEFSADPGAALDDRKQWAKANPSFPARTPVESVERLREQLTNDDSFRREGLGIWDDNSSSEFPHGVWRDAQVELTDSLTAPVVALDVRLGVQASVSLGVVGGSPFGPVATVGLYEERQGARWTEEQVVAWVAGELESRGIDEVVVDEYGENGPLIPLLEQRGFTVIRLNTRDMRNACMGIHNAFLNRQVSHIGDRPLDVAVAGVRRRTSGEGWLWSRVKSVTDVGPLMAVAAAWWVFSSGEGDYEVMDSFF